MRKLKEVLRLRFELKLGYQQIGRSCSIGVSTVHKYLKRAEAAGVTWPLPEDWDEARVEAIVFPRREPNLAEQNPARTPPDFAAIHEQLRGSKYVTLQLLWEEYRQAQPDAYRYSRYVAAVFMLPWDAGLPGVRFFDGSYGNINRPHAGAIDLSRTPSTKAAACVGVQSQPTP
jgi:hypothetical protein